MPPTPEQLESVCALIQDALHQTDIAENMAPVATDYTCNIRGLLRDVLKVLEATPQVLVEVAG